MRNATYILLRKGWEEIKKEIMEQPLQDFFVFVEEDVVVSRDSAPMTVCP